jgi:N-acetylmuramoyl-L-alanine amidase
MPRTHLLTLAGLLAAALARGGATNDAAWVPIDAALVQGLGLTGVLRTADGLTLSNASHVLQLCAGRRGATIDGVMVWLHLPPREAGSNDLREVARADFDAVLQPLLWRTNGAPARLRVVIDAGHGGTDAGAGAAGAPLAEKDVTLDVARRVAARLRAAGDEVWLTRTNDVYLTLQERTRVASRHDAQVFLSIHANSSPHNPLAAGAETFVLPAPGCSGTAEHPGAALEACPGNRFDATNTVLGFAIHRRCSALAWSDRGLKRARYVVLKEAPCPAALVECGFLTSANDAALLGRAAYRAQLAAAIAAGIRDFAAVAPRPEAPSWTPPCTNGAAARVATGGQ